MRPLRTRSALVLIWLVLSACTAAVVAGRPVAPGTSAKSVPRLVQVWTSRGISPVSPITLIAGVAVGYGVADSQLMIFGLDARTGRTLWRHPASTAALTPGVPVEVSDVNGAVAYFAAYQKRSDTTARMIVADPHTGRTRVASPPMRWSDQPYPCPDERNATCSAAPEPGYDDSIEWRLDPHSGQTYPSGNDTGGGRGIGTDLVDPLNRNPELVERRVDGTRVWTRPVAAIFGPGVSTDNGWLFEKYGAAYAGTLGAGGTYSHDKRTYVVDLARGSVSAGFRSDDGALLWRSQGTHVDCYAALYWGDDHPIPVRCRYSGTVSFDLAADHAHVVRTTRARVSVRLEGFDPATGRTRWSRALGPAQAMLGGGSAPLASGTDAVVKSADGYLVVDLRTGATRRPTAAEAFWCIRDRRFRAIPAHLPDEGEYREASVVAPCTASGGRTSRTPSTLSDAVSTSAPIGLRLVSTADAVLAYRTG